MRSRTYNFGAVGAETTSGVGGQGESEPNLKVSFGTPFSSVTSNWGWDGGCELPWNTDNLLP